MQVLYQDNTNEISLEPVNERYVLNNIDLSVSAHHIQWYQLSVLIIGQVYTYPQLETQV